MTGKLRASPFDSALSSPRQTDTTTALLRLLHRSACRSHAPSWGETVKTHIRTFVFLNVCCRISEQRTNSLNSVSPAAKCSGVDFLPAVDRLAAGLRCDRPRTAPCCSRWPPNQHRAPTPLPPGAPGTLLRPRGLAHQNISGWTTCTAVIGLFSLSDCWFWRVWIASSRRQNPRTPRLLRPCRTMRPGTLQGNAEPDLRDEEARGIYRS